MDKETEYQPTDSEKIHYLEDRVGTLEGLIDRAEDELSRHDKEILWLALYTVVGFVFITAGR
jgi:hypothetical protein